MEWALTEKRLNCSISLKTLKAMHFLLFILIWVPVMSMRATCTRKAKCHPKATIRDEKEKKKGKGKKKKPRNKNFPSWIKNPSTSPHMFDSNNILLAVNCLQLECYIFGGNNPEKHSTKLMIIWLHSPYLERISIFTCVYKYINCHLPSSEKKIDRGGSDGGEGKVLPIRPKACQNPVSEGNETKCRE